MKYHAYIAILACLLPCTCTAYELIGTATLSETLVAQHYTINPLLDAVIVVDRTIPSFEYQTFYCAGSADEAEGRQGRLHFLEHIMIDRGSYEPGELNQIIAENSGQSGAVTSYHFTRFTLRFPKDKFDLAVEIDRNIYYDTVIDEEVVEKEKKIVLTERSQRLAQPERRSANYFYGLIYDKKNFDGLGAETFIRQLEPIGLKDYYENFLREQKRLIVVIGDVDIDHALTKLDEAYGNDITPIKLYAPQSPDRGVLGKRLKNSSNNLNFTIFRKGWYTPNLGNRDYAGLLIVERLLEKPSNSLSASLVNSRLAKSFSVSVGSHKGFGLMTCYAELPHNISRNTIQDMIHVALVNLKTISDAEFDAARNQQLNTLYSAFYNRSSMAISFGSAFAHADDPLLYPKLIQDLKSIRAEDIPRIIDQYLKDDNSITHSLTEIEKKEPPPRKPRSFGDYVRIVLALVGFLTLLGGIVALLVWGIKKWRRKARTTSSTSQKAIFDDKIFNPDI
ncbi:MAG: insulinase family protein [Gemmatimonadetes bacterium]|nr:insulinase family protein [Gemmatimonadota bacterium]MYK54756.1 insulinase family protein [Gemmatimonadota bacterium]